MNEKAYKTVSFTMLSDVHGAGQTKLVKGYRYSMPMKEHGTNWIRVVLHESPLLTKTLFNFEADWKSPKEAA